MQVTTTTNTEFTDSWPCLKISWLHWKSGSSNLLVDRTYSIVALRTFVLAFLSNELLSKRRVFIKTASQRRLLSIFSTWKKFLMLVRKNLISSNEKFFYTCPKEKTIFFKWKKMSYIHLEENLISPNRKIFTTVAT